MPRIRTRRTFARHGFLTAVVEALFFEGGDPPRSNPCGALSAHGFLGIEERVVGAIARWIRRARPE